MKNFVKRWTLHITQFLALFALFMYISDNYGAPVELDRIQPMSAALERHQYLLRHNDVIGEHMKDIKEGTLNVHDVMGQADAENQRYDEGSELLPMSIEEILDFLNNFIANLHQRFIGHVDKNGVFHDHKKYNYVDVWKLFFDYADEVLYPWDQEYLKRMPKRRDDGSIFLSVATYRDENCLNTLTGAFEKSHNPEMLNVGLVQQNCVENCRSGILDPTGRTESVPPDPDCHKLFCESEIGRPHCEAGRVRAMHINEPESLGPYFARYLASKLWYGESWYMQIDAHMFFLQDWDKISIDMLKAAPSKKPVISHYPPPEEYDFSKSAWKAAPRLCGPVFAHMDLENQIIRLEGSYNYDAVQLKTPRFAPFIAAGYFVAFGDFVRDVPFDPFLPWIFMGEETSLSARLWTNGYDIFSPSKSVTSHIYGRRHTPKFWESVHRLFHPGVHNPLQMLVLDRVKNQLGYPESADDFVQPKSLLKHLEKYSMGTERPLEKFMEYVGLDMKNKQVIFTGWCEKGRPPPNKLEFESLYEFVAE